MSRQYLPDPRMPVQQPQQVLAVHRIEPLSRWKRLWLKTKMTPARTAFALRKIRLNWLIVRDRAHEHHLQKRRA